MILKLFAPGLEKTSRIGYKDEKLNEGSYQIGFHTSSQKSVNIIKKYITYINILSSDNIIDDDKNESNQK